MSWREHHHSTYPSWTYGFEQGDEIMNTHFFEIWWSPGGHCWVLSYHDGDLHRFTNDQDLTEAEREHYLADPLELTVHLLEAAL